MRAISKILRANGYDSVSEMAVGDHVEIEVSGFMPLVIEKVGQNRLSVAHYYTQMGDLMSDPEIVFRVVGDTWVPVEYTQHPHIYQHNEHGLQGPADFAKQWSQNLETQGFVEAARQATTDQQKVTA